MNKRKIISIVILVIGIILIVSGVIAIGFTDKEKPNDSPEINNNNSESDNSHSNNSNIILDENGIDYDNAYAMAESLYGGNGNTVELKEEEDKFIIYVKNEKGIVLNTFNMDKVTGSISEEGYASSSSASSD